MNQWNSMIYVSALGKGLVILELPENNPKYGMRFFKHIKNDTCRHVIKNGVLRDKYVLERDDNGNIGIERTVILKLK